MRVFKMVLMALQTGMVLTVLGTGELQAQTPSNLMAPAEQNRIVQKYCAVCHTDRSMIGGLSLEHFDAAHLDPSLAAMLLSKAKNGAFGAAGVKPPDRVIQDAFFSTLSSEAAGADGWTVSRTESPASQAAILRASILRAAPSMDGGDPDIYRLTLTCHLDSRESEMKVSWSPWDVPLTGGSLSVATDGKAADAYTIKNGAGSAVLNTTEITGVATSGVMGFPTRTLTVRTARMSANQNTTVPLPEETVIFAFGELSPAVRQELSMCFAKPSHE